MVKTIIALCVGGIAALCLASLYPTRVIKTAILHPVYMYECTSEPKALDASTCAAFLPLAQLVGKADR